MSCYCHCHIEHSDVIEVKCKCLKNCIHCKPTLSVDEKKIMSKSINKIIKSYSILYEYLERLKAKELLKGGK